MTVEQFIKKNADLLDIDNGIYKLYSMHEMGITPAMITKCLLEYGLNPLEWMDAIPQGYAQGDTAGPSHLVIPSNIKSVGVAAFSKSDVQIIEFEEGCENIRSLAFSAMKNLDVIKFPRSLKSIETLILSNSDPKRIEYAGTIAEWKQITKRKNWAMLDRSDELIIECIDGDYCPNDE